MMLADQIRGILLVLGRGNGDLDDSDGDREGYLRDGNDRI